MWHLSFCLICVSDDKLLFITIISTIIIITITTIITIIIIIVIIITITIFITIIIILFLRSEYRQALPLQLCIWLNTFW